MAETTPFELNKMFSSLTGKQVTFAQTKQAPPDSKKHVYGTYSLVPEETMRLVKADVALIGSFGGALMGLPKSAVLDGLKEVPLDETIRDAMHEILNVSATLVSREKRAVFQKMFFNMKELPDAATALIKAPKLTMHFQVSIAGYDGGAFTLMG